jgi:hypothetical protein
MAALTQYDLGKFGVNVDSSPIHKLDGELAQAQNAIRSTYGADGGLVNRGGYSNLNATATGASVLGGIGVPLGDGSSSTDRRLYIPSYNTGATYAGWVYSTDDFVTATAVASVPAPPGHTGGLGVPTNAAEFNNALFYITNAGLNTASQSIRKYNGRTDVQHALTLPTGAVAGITNFAVLDGIIYVNTLDTTGGDTLWVGRVFSLDPATGHLVQIGPAFPTGYAPGAMAMYQNDLFVVGNRTTNTNLVHIFKIRPGVETTWTDDETMGTGVYQVTDLYRWGAYLYVSQEGTTAGNVNILRRDIDGTYTAVLTAANSGVGSASFGMNFHEFGGYLYIAYYFPAGTSLVYRSATGASGAWSSLTTPTAAQLGLISSPTGTALLAIPVSSTSIYKSTNGTTFGAAINLSSLSGQTISTGHKGVRLDVVNL